MNKQMNQKIIILPYTCKEIHKHFTSKVPLLYNLSVHHDTHRIHWDDWWWFLELDYCNVWKWKLLKWSYDGESLLTVSSNSLNVLYNVWDLSFQVAILMGRDEEVQIAFYVLLKHVNRNLKTRNKTNLWITHTLHCRQCHHTSWQQFAHLECHDS